MTETLFPPSPNWNCSNVLTYTEDGKLAYGSMNSVVILKYAKNSNITPLIINGAHSDKITSVIFSPTCINEKFENSVLTCSYDGFVKLWHTNTLVNIIGHNAHLEQKGSTEVKVMCADWCWCNPQYVVSAAENDTVVMWDIVANQTVRYYFPKLKPAVVSCSFHNEKIVGIGSKSGLVYIVKLTKKGEIVHKLRGHDKEIQSLSWCPYDCNVPENYSGDFLLASSANEKDIYIWQTMRGACEARVPLPKTPLNKRGIKYFNKHDHSPNFTPIFWAEPNVLYAGTPYGELIFCEMNLILSNQVENKNTENGKLGTKTHSNWQLKHSFHSGPLLGISCVQKLQPMKFAEQNVSNELMEVSNSLIWTLGKDRRLIACHRYLENKSAVFNLHTLNGHAYYGAVSPHDPSQIAIAVGDAKLRVWNMRKPSGHAEVYWQSGSARIYSLEWHPMKEGLLAYGTSDGRVGLIDVYTQKQPSYFKLGHAHTIYHLSWGPSISQSSSKSTGQFSVYSVGGDTVMIHDPGQMDAASVNLSEYVDVPCKKISDISWKPDYTILAVGSSDGAVYLLKGPRLDIICVLECHRKRVHSLTWHPTTATLDSDISHMHGYFTCGSLDTDHDIKVYNVFMENDDYKVEEVCALRGHSGYVQFVSWNPHWGGRLISSGSDRTIRMWDVIMKTQLMCFSISHWKLILFSIWSPLDPNILILGFGDRMLASWNVETVSDKKGLVNIRDHNPGKAGKLAELINSSSSGKATFGNDNKGTTTVKENNQPKGVHAAELVLAKTTDASKTSKENKMFPNAWKFDGEPLENCYTFLKNSFGTKGLDFILPFLGTENVLVNYLGEEEEIYKKSNKSSEYIQLSLWRGNLKDVITEKIKTGHLDDFLVSLAPVVSPRLWQEACVSYSKSLAEKKFYRKAACYLMAVHKIYDAIELLQSAELYLEALCVARCRLPESDPIFSDIVRNYGDMLADSGAILKASECFVFLGDYLEAGKLLGKKNKAEYLSLAAIAYQRAGAKNLEFQCANSALIKCLESLNWELAFRIWRDHITLKHLRIMAETHRLLYQLDKGKTTLDSDLMSLIEESIRNEKDSSTYDNLKYLYDKNSMYTHEREVFVAITREVCLAFCALEKETALVHIIQALSSASRFIKNKDVSVLYKLCQWLSGPDGYFNDRSVFCCKGESVGSKLMSARAFLCQGIVEHVDKILEENSADGVTVVEQFESTLKDLVDDLLDGDTFGYFKNQIMLKSLENSVSASYTKINTGNKDINEKYVKDEIIDVADVAENDVKADQGEHGKEQNSVSRSECDLIDRKNGKAEGSADSGFASEIDRIKKLKAEIKDFENLRIIAPNPVIVYCTLRRVAERFKSAVEESDLTDVVEKKWKELDAS